jgi:hypothetical protein
MPGCTATSADHQAGATLEFESGPAYRHKGDGEPCADEHEHAE